MQKLLYGYGYRRTYTCSLNLGDTSAAPTALVGLSAATRKSASGLISYTCTLPQPLSYDYNISAQVVENGVEVVTNSTNFSVIAAKSVDRSTFSFGLQNNNGLLAKNSISVSLVLIEK